MALSGVLIPCHRVSWRPKTCKCGGVSMVVYGGVSKVVQVWWCMYGGASMVVYGGVSMVVSMVV